MWWGVCILVNKISISLVVADYFLSSSENALKGTLTSFFSIPFSPYTSSPLLGDRIVHKYRNHIGNSRVTDRDHLYSVAIMQAVHQQPHKPVCHQLFQPVSHQLPQPVCHRLHQPVCHQLHQAVCHQFHQPVSHQLQQPICLQLHQPVCHQLPQPVSDQLHQQVRHRIHQQVCH